MGAIRKIKRKRGVRFGAKFEATIQVDGKQLRRRFDDKTVAEHWLDDRKRDIREGRVTGIVRKTFGEIAELYLEHKHAKRSLQDDIEIFRRRLVPFFGADTNVVDVNARRIAEYEHHCATAIHPQLKRPISRSRINRHLAALRCALRLAQEWGHLRDAPRFKLKPEPEGRVRFLDQDEAAKLRAACRGSKNPFLFAIVTVGMNTGMRKTEITSLTWDRVDFSRGRIILERTKSGRPREVPMNQSVHNTLSDLRRERDQAAEDGSGAAAFVFARRGGAVADPDTAFRTALKRAGITGCRFHDLRHTAASWMVMAGVEIVKVKEILGHRTLAMTMRYAHLSPGHLHDAVARLDAVFAEGAAKPSRPEPAAAALAS